MTITAAIVLYASTWFLVLFCVLSFRFQSQAEAGEAVEGTPPSAAPSSFDPARKARVTTVITTVLFVVMYLVITSGWITIENMDVFGVMDMVPKARE